MKFNFLFVALLAIMVSSCQKTTIEDSNVTPDAAQTNPSGSNLRVIAGFPETFEGAAKTAYTTGSVTLTTGAWTLNDAVLGTSATDPKIGLQSVRIRNAGKLTMGFNVVSGISTVSIQHAVYSGDAASTWSLWASQNSGSTWTQVGSPVATSSSLFQTANFTLNLAGTVRLEIRKVNSSARFNIDNITLNEADANATPTRDDNLALGNPSNAATTTTTPNNYLMLKSQYALAYNSSKGGPNWVSWHLSSAWKGTAVRLDNFATDTYIPTTMVRVNSTDYASTGFDRGHQCPSDDRDGSADDNTATFLMSNMLPQSPNLNRVTWANLEAYCRTLLTSGNELYIITGGYGQGGTGSNGGVTNTIAGTKINVPSRCWKVIVILPVGTNDVARINTATRVIAVDMPNTQTVSANAWGTYRTSVDAIEAATGYDFLTALPVSLQGSLETRVDNGPTQ